MDRRRSNREAERSLRKAGKQEGEGPRAFFSCLPAPRIGVWNSGGAVHATADCNQSAIVRERVRGRRGRGREGQGRAWNSLPASPPPPRRTPTRSRTRTSWPRRGFSSSRVPHSGMTTDFLPSSAVSLLPAVCAQARMEGPKQVLHPSPYGAFLFQRLESAARLALSRRSTSPPPPAGDGGADDRDPAWSLPGARASLQCP